MAMRTRSSSKIADLDSASDLRVRQYLRHDSANSISYERSASKLCDGSFSGRNYNEGSDSDSSSPRSKREAPEKPALRFTFQSQCLCDFHSLPQQLRFNKFVHSGYRVRYSMRECVQSLVQWHNESLNIFSHMAALVLVVVLMTTGVCRVTAPDRLAAAVGLSMLPLFFAYGLSIAYHGFMAHWRFSEHTAEAAANYGRLLCADVSGVVAALALPWVCTTYFAFAKDPVLLLAFGCTLGVSSVFGIFATQATDQTKRIIPLGLLLMSHWLTITTRMKGYGLQCAQSMPWYLASETLVVAGGIINALFLPERFFPGKLDFALNSHQIMHLCTLAATYTVYSAMREDYLCFTGQATA